MSTLIVVAGALIEQGRLLVAQRARPPELAGCWELPGGKVGAGESDASALQRELLEELGIEVSVGALLGDDVALSETATLRAYLVKRTGGVLHPHDHRALRWVGAADLDALDWVPADRAWLPDLAASLRSVVRDRDDRDRR
ncbi:(deoxy)nucleoside triphosphate pyrophosphohydrolase [Mycolicibacterium sp. 3033]|nr:(deoxy)nucleoside triphosphate pyrophosphohydrolase [Mycolicibacterium aurantiacum]